MPKAPAVEARRQRDSPNRSSEPDNAARRMPLRDRGQVQPLRCLKAARITQALVAQARQAQNLKRDGSPRKRASLSAHAQHSEAQPQWPATVTAAKRRGGRRLWFPEEPSGKRQSRRRETGEFLGEAEAQGSMRRSHGVKTHRSRSATTEGSKPGSCGPALRSCSRPRGTRARGREKQQAGMAGAKSPAALRAAQYFEGHPKPHERLSRQARDQAARRQNVRRAAQVGW